VKALVLGSAGQLGRELVRTLADEVAWKGDRAEIDVSDGAAAAALLARARPDVVFNATAYNRVDAAEAEPLAAFAVNAVAPHHLARAAREAGALLVHFSTDYVFDGTSPRPYREDDPTRPLGAYGASKLAGEHLVAAAGGEHLVVRTSGLLGRGGSEQKGGSFVERIVARARAGEPLRVVADQVFAPTCAADLARATIALVRARARGLFHVTNGGSCSWHELACAALAAAGIEAPVERVALGDLSLPARRPLRSVLSCERYLALGLPPLRHWRDALPDCLP
jgi:dTDP-4-dehydrorhamnose reductase